MNRTSNRSYVSHGRHVSRRRIVLAGAALPLLAASAASAACGVGQQGSGTATDQAPRPTGQPATLRYLGRGNQVILDIQRGIADDFEKANPNIKVQMEPAADYLQKLQAELAAGTASDVAFTAFGSVRLLAKQGGLVPLDPFMARDVKKGDYYDYALESGKYKDKYYAFPYDGGTYALAYNKDLFDKAQIKYPDDTWTWDQYVQTAARLTVDQSGKRAGESGFDPSKIAQYGSAAELRSSYWYWIWANGGDILSADKTKSTLDSAVALDTIQWVADLGLKQVIMPTPAFPDSNPSAFESGRVALQPHGRWSVATYRQLGKFAWDVAPMPKGKAGRIGYGWFSGMSIVQGTKLRGEAWEFCKFCGSEPGQKRLMELGQVLPPMPRMATSDAFLKSSPPANNKTYMEAIATTRLHPSAWIIDTTAYNTVLNPALNEIWTGVKPARTALPPLVPQLNAILAQG